MMIAEMYQGRIQENSLEGARPYFSWGSGGRCKPPGGVRGGAPKAIAF